MPRACAAGSSAFRCALLFCPTALLCAGAGLSDDPLICKHGFLRVVSPDGATMEQCKLAVKKVVAAWKFDLSVMQWGHPEVMEVPFTLRLISDERMKREHGEGMRAFTVTGGGRIDLRMSILDTDSLDFTIAHELGHVQMYRAVRGSPQAGTIPHYFLEGHGQMMNQLYSDSVHRDVRAVATREAKLIMALSPNELRTYLTDDAYWRTGTAKEKADKMFKMECIGTYLVEHLRAQKGVADAVPRMGQLFEAVGRGETYEQAFAHVYGFSVKRAASELLTDFERTQSHPADRLKGTRYEPFIPAPK
jgi:hypothetical protein